MDVEKLIETIDAAKKYNLQSFGYKYINLDDCWALVKRDDQNRFIPDPSTFPHGIKYISDYAHENGFKIGIYTDIGIFTCAGRAGSYGHYDVDAKTFKVDFCFTPPDVLKEPWKFYSNFREWAPEISNMWRTTQDIYASFYSVLWNMQKTEVLSQYAGLYNYNDPDMLEVGVGSLSYEENKSHFSLWAIMTSPLILGNDLRNISNEVLEIITNMEVIKVNQDELGEQGKITKELLINIHEEICFHTKTLCTWVQIWKKNLVNNDIAVLIFNHAASDKTYDDGFNDGEIVDLKWEYIGIEPTKKYKIRDIWDHKELGEYSSSYTTPLIKQHDCLFLVFSPS